MAQDPKRPPIPPPVQDDSSEPQAEELRSGEFQVIGSDEVTPAERSPFEEPLDESTDTTPTTDPAIDVPDELSSKRRRESKPPIPTPITVPVLAPAFLAIERGPGAGTSVPIPEGHLLLGRSSSCGLKLDHSSVSRQHAVLLRQAERFFINDAGSHNGTYVNGRQVRGQLELFSGDRIALGKTVVVLRCGSASQEQSAFVGAVAERPWLLLGMFALALALGLGAMLLLARSKAPEQPTAAELINDLPPARGEIEVPEHMLVEPRKAPQPGSAAPASPKPEPHPGATALSGKERALALYEAGQLDQAVAAANAGQEPALAERISSFQRELSSGKVDASANNGDEAIKHFRSALALDETLSKGWGRYSGEIRVQLSNIYLEQAVRAAKDHAWTKAADLAELSLKYDPQNTRAQKLREQIGKP